MPMEVDTPEEQQSDEQQQVGNVQLQLSILNIIKAAQLQNGLKHGDYARYRQYCARRLRSLYQAVKLLHGKGRYQKKKLDVQHITDVRHLHIVLISAERCWAHAMQLKKEAEEDGATAVLRKRHHAQRRLKKASVWAAELSRFASATCDTRSSLEAEAYAAWMSGNVVMDRESDWDKALATFTKAKKLFAELAKVSQPDSATLCASMVEEIEPALRYCSYQIERAGGAGRAEDAGQLAALAEKGEGLGGGLLQSKLASLAAEAQTAQAAATSSFEWRGIKAAVSLERVRLPLHNAAEAAATLDSAMDEDGVPIERVLLQHDKLNNLYSEARAAARSAAKAAAAGAAAGSSGAASAGSKAAREAAEAADVEELAALDKALSGRMLDVSIARAQAAAADAAARFNAGLVRGAAGGARGQRGPAAKGERPAKPDDLVRLYTTLSQLASEQEELSSHLDGKSGEALAAAAAARAAAYAAYRVFYAGHVALSSGDKWGEAAGLFRRSRERAAAAVEAIQGLPKSEAALASEVPGLEQLQAGASAYLLVAAAEAAAAGAAGAEAAAKGMEGLGLAAAAQQQQQQYLYDALDSWQSFAGSGPGGSKGARLYRGPYPLAAIAPRPIMLDSAGGEVAYPDVGHRGGKKAKRSLQPQGTFARLFGGWGS